MLNSITLPSDSRVLRDFRKPLSSAQQKLYLEGKLGSYDTHTLFYDIFFSVDGKEIIGLAPPALNLNNLFKDMKVFVSDKQIDMSLYFSHKKVDIYKAVLKHPEIHQEVDIKILLNDGSAYEFVLKKSTPLAGKSLVTIQKNNQIRWIRDWIKYYKYSIGIENIFIYDNNSDYQDSLQHELGEDATVIPWNFPFGVNSRSGNKFCQVGALNHFKYKYGWDCKTILNFDIDELLKVNTLDFMKPSQLLRFNSFCVPFIKPATADYSFIDFNKRSTSVVNGGHKYCAPGNLKGVMDVHAFDLLPKWWHRLVPTALLKGPVLPVSEAYFLHYYGISTNWKNGERMKDFVGDEKALLDNEISMIFKDFKKIQ